MERPTERGLVLTRLNVGLAAKSLLAAVAIVIALASG
jgi:hypothetical protein